MRYIKMLTWHESWAVSLRERDRKDACLECIQRLTDFPRGVCPQKIGLAKKISIDIFKKILYNIYRKWEMVMNKNDRKKTGDELQGFLMWRNRGSVVAPKKGKGSFKRKAKHKNKEY